MFRWITPIPPSRAIAIAMAASVTVSIAAETSGMFSAIRREKRERVSVWSGSTVEAAGWSRTSSKVRARGASATLRPYMVHRIAAMAACTRSSFSIAFLSPPQTMPADADDVRVDPPERVEVVEDERARERDAETGRVAGRDEPGEARPRP